MSDTLPTATRVADPGIRALYRLENRWQAWLDVEVALAKAQAELGIIPAAAAEAIAAASRLDQMDRARIDEGLARTGHTIVPLVWEFSRVVGDPHGGWVHWGATTQNITQTGDLLVLRQAHGVFMRQIGEILSAMADLDDRVRGLKAGSDDYLTKPFAFAELLARVEALNRRGKGEGPVTKLVVEDLELDLLSRQVKRAGQKVDLQPREFRLLEYLMRHAGQVVTRTMLLEGVWDYHFDPQTNVIDVHVSRLRQKVDKPFPTGLIHTVRNAGYMLRAEQA